MAKRIVRMLRDGWLIAGITLILFLALEGIYRMQAAVRSGGGRQATVDSSQHPYAGQAWFARFRGPRGLDARTYRLDSYRGFWLKELNGPGLHIDSAGVRFSAWEPAHPRRRLFLLGGSAMWGFAARDSFTIPSFVSRRLQERGIRDVEVVNLAQPGFNSTQEATTLLVELARGDVPAGVIVFDGYNDVATAFHYGAPGHTYSEERAQERLDLGRRGFFGELIGLGRHSALIQRLAALRPAGAGRTAPDPARICPETAAYYGRVVRSVEGMGEAYGFPVLYFLQPYHATTRKPLSDWERSLPRSPGFATCWAAFDSVMADQRGKTWFPLDPLFDTTAATVFVDKDSHVTEAANDRIAGRMVELMAPLLAEKTP